MSYSDLLKDPRWQKKRLEIFSRDNFTCVSCDSQNKTLNVHHHYYISGRMPWEYSDDMLVTLCDECHEKEESLKYLDADYMKVMLCSGLLRQDLERLMNSVLSRGGGSKPSFFRKIFNRLLDRVEFKIRVKPSSKHIKLTDLLNG